MRLRLTRPLGAVMVSESGSGAHNFSPLVLICLTSVTFTLEEALSWNENPRVEADG